MKSNIIRTLLLIIVAITAFGIFIYLPTWRAQQMRSAIEKTDWSKTDNNTVSQLIAQFGGTFKCSTEWCEGQVERTNRLLAFFHLAPLMKFQVLIHTKLNRVRDYTITLTNLGNGESSIWIVKYFDPDIVLENGQAFAINTVNKQNDPRVMIRMTRLATQENQNLVELIDLKCLSRIGGCSRQELGAEVWKLGTFSYPAN